MTNRFLVVLAGLLALPPAGLVGGDMTQASGEPTALTDAQREEFLRRGKVDRTRGISVGINNTTRLTLNDGTLTHDAHLNTVDIYKASEPLPSGTELNFRDCYKFNIAAYKLDRLLRLNMVPVTVERVVGGKRGSVAWWVDGVKMMEKERFKKKIPPPDQERWNRQMYRVRLFNELVYNTDANLGNLLITGDWDLRMVDFTRAFRAHKKLREPGNLTRIDREALEALRRLSADDVRRELGPWLKKPEVEGLLARRDLIVAHFDSEISTRGQTTVLTPAP